MKTHRNSTRRLGIPRKDFIKWTALAAAAVVVLVLISVGTEFLLYKATGVVLRPSNTEKEIQDFWDMKPSVREAAAQRLCTVNNADALDEQISLVWGQCEKEGVKDYDKNGVVNCCDRATAFCIKWKQSYRNDIRLCQQQTNAMNHMYVQIYLPDYGWWSVDPAFTGNGTHDMQAVWGCRYNPGQDITEAYWVRVFSKHIR